MSSLGTDFIFAEILPRLPVKALVRFKCVSESFKTFISSPDFAKQYYSLSSDAKDLRLIIPGKKGITLYDLDSTTATTAFHCRDRNSLHVIGSSNGLICITNDFYGINKLFVLNPTTRIYKDIPIPDNIVEARPLYYFGFAFDPENLGFKIVIVSEEQKRTAEYRVVNQTRITKVYSLNTETWTEIETELPGDAIIEVGADCRGTLIHNSLLLWKFWIPSSCKYKIGCFDVCKSKWTSYDDPIHSWNFPKLGVYDECLLLSYEIHDKSSCLWVMKEFGVQDLRVKLMYIPILDALPVAYRRGSTEILIRHDYGSRLYWYNMNNGEINEAKFDRAPCFGSRQACVSGKSMADLPGGKPFR